MIAYRRASMPPGNPSEASESPEVATSSAVPTSRRIPVSRTSFRYRSGGEARPDSGASPATWLLDRAGDGEDGQVHGDEEAADDAAEEHHHDRLDHAGEGGHRRVYLVVVEVGDLAEHLIHRAGRLADADHLHHHAGEHLRLRQRLHDRLALGDLLLGVADRLLH